MAKRAKNKDEEGVLKNWREGDVIQTFKLNRIITQQTPLMLEWLNAEAPSLNVAEQYDFDRDLIKAQKYIAGWNEEDLKMKFISTILKLGQFDVFDCRRNNFIKVTNNGVVIH